MNLSICIHITEFICVFMNRHICMGRDIRFQKNRHQQYKRNKNLMMQKIMRRKKNHLSLDSLANVIVLL